jgi:cardiolipin synthase
MAKVGQAKSVAVAFIGKLKTVLQMVAIPLLLFEDRLFGVIDCYALGTVLIYVAAVLTVVSMLYYLRRAAAPLAQG